MRLNLQIRPGWSTPSARLAGVSAALATFLALIPGAQAQISADAVKIGVLTDESGQFSDIGAAGSALAAQMVADDLGGTVQGKPITIVHAGHQNKADIGSSIVRRWFDNDGVDAVVDLPFSSVALAAQEIARNAKKTLLIAGAATSDLT
jgi:branched-chain amino acid transport system substrate-binding protein